MAPFRFIPVTPHPILGPYLEKMYVFESVGRLPVEDRKLIVPNANLKLTVTYRNGMEANVAGNPFSQKENEISLAGFIDTPVMLDPLEDAQTGTIIIEFNALGAYRLFRLRFAELKNQIVELADLLGNTAMELRNKVGEASTLNLKLQILQNYLINRLAAGAEDPIYDHCIKRINAAKGMISVSRLEKETGYSSRWLNCKFTEHLGTSPKNFAEIVRFKQVYQAFSSGEVADHRKGLIYDYYYDQSHFLRAFKRFTGSTPSELRNSVNELADRHYLS